MKIEIINVASTTKPAKNGTYTQLEVAYKNHDFQGKIESKKIMSFTNKDVFGILSKAVNGQFYDVERVKEGEYWQWSKVTLVQTEGNTSQQTGSIKSSANPTPKSTYETPEERAIRQRLIVRQSSITNAIETLKVDKKALTTDEVLGVAKIYFDWVMSNGDTNNNNLMSADNVIPNNIADMDDDIPF